MSEESTTPDLVELLRRADEAAERRDWDAVMSIFAPDAVWDQFGMHVLDGRAAIRGYLDDGSARSKVSRWRRRKLSTSATELVLLPNVPGNGRRPCPSTLTSCARSSPPGNTATSSAQPSGHTRTSSSSWPTAPSLVAGPGWRGQKKVVGLS